eukprot:c14564_g1_i1.p1 GENE.c14564_g1_i1~~c14564_g1_i1.p1  ORF type:complete len:181 (+),score=42.29 c14564_g1_i1:53-595(+)
MFFSSIRGLCSKIQKDSLFYQKHAANREYFYFIDLNGRLFLEETQPRNITTCLKDTRFLNFFWKKIKKNDTGRFSEYPFISPCGTEMNYITCADTPIVFHSLENNNLSWGGDMKVQFQPDQLCINSLERLYHPTGITELGNGLIRSHVAIQLSEMFRVANSTKEEIWLEWEGKNFLIKKI